MNGIVKAVGYGCILGLLCAGFSACSGGGGGNGGKRSAPVAGRSALAAKVKALALVLSSDGRPVENALISGGDSVSTSDGIIAGTVTAPDSGWIGVSADGYAAGYMKRRGTALKGWNIFETRLTPIESAMIYDGAATGSLAAGGGDLPAVKIDVGPSAFAEKDVIVELAVMSPMNVGPEFAPLSEGAGLHLKEAFFVSAHDAAGHEIPLAAGRHFTATIRDSGEMGNEFTLASFDAAAGRWAVRAKGCSRADADHLRCTLPHGATYGLFGRSPFEAATGDRYRDALHAYREAVAAWRAQGGARGASAPAQLPPAVREAGGALTEAARAYARDHPDEQGQMRLLSAAAAVRALGMSEVSRDLVAQAQKYVQLTARDMLGKPSDCASMRSVLDTAAKADVLGLNHLRRDLIHKARNSYGDCDVWAGTVRYTLFMKGQWPGKGGYRRLSGPQIWNEEHRVKLLVSPKSRKTEGEDHVTLVMPKVSYRRRFDNGCGGKSYEQRDLYAVPSPARMALVFNGLYDYPRDRFKLSALKPPSSDKALPRVTLRRSSRLWKNTAAGCRESSAENTAALVKDYSTLLGDGFAGKPGGPSLEDMLNDGEQRKLGNGKVVQGGRLIDVDSPPEGLPFTRAAVSWHLINVPPTP